MSRTLLAREANQARLLAAYAQEFMGRSLAADIPRAVQERTKLFLMDSLACGLSAVKRNYPSLQVLQEEALAYTLAPPAPIPGYTKLPWSVPTATVLGTTAVVPLEKAVLFNCAAVRELDANGTVFGFDPRHPTDRNAGEFGHNDFYPVVLASAEAHQLDGETALKAMILHDEIRGRLCESFSLQSHRIDHVLHGGIATCAVYGALLDCTEKQIESAISLLVSHYVPWRSIRAGHQLNDSKGCSAAFTTEMAVQSVHRAALGFEGPADIFRNPASLFRVFEPQSDGQSPFDLFLADPSPTATPEDFAITNMHFKLGLYEHQSAGAVHALLALLAEEPGLQASAIRGITVAIYDPAYGIICDPAKWAPTTRQSADHSLPYILARLLVKARAAERAGQSTDHDLVGLWEDLMLTPEDYNAEALEDYATRECISQVRVEHDPALDAHYPAGIPTRVIVDLADGRQLTRTVHAPLGHAAYPDEAACLRLLTHKMKTFLDDPDTLERVQRAARLEELQLEDMHTFVADLQASIPDVNDAQEPGSV